MELTGGAWMMLNLHQKMATAVKGAVISLFVILGLLVIPSTAHAHWCSNIYNTYARIVVKPERDQIDIQDGETGELKVRVRNNFPYTLQYIKLRTYNAPPELSISVSPTEAVAEQNRVYTGQEVTFTLQITRDGGSDHNVSALNLQIGTRVEYITSPAWRSSDDQWVNQDPDPQQVRTPSCSQSCELNYAKLADLTCPDCESFGVNMLIENWIKETADNCNGTDFENTQPQRGLRAGQALAIRLRYRNFIDVSRTDAVQAFLDAMNSPFEITRGIAAFFAAYGGSDPGVDTRIRQMATDDIPDPSTCNFSPSDRARRMAMSALLILGDSSYETEVTTCASNESDDRVKAVCAAALGIRGQDDPVIQSLRDNVPSGAIENTTYTGLTLSALLQLVVLVRRGGPEGVGVVSFYPEDVIPDNVSPRAPTNLQVQPVN